MTNGPMTAKSIDQIIENLSYEVKERRLILEHNKMDVQRWVPIDLEDAKALIAYVSGAKHVLAEIASAIVKGNLVRNDGHD